MATDASRSSLRARLLKRGAVVVLAFVAAGYAERDLLLGTPVEVVAATRADLTQTVVASGRVITPQRVTVGTTSTDRVARIPVHEEQRVKRGEELIVLDDRNERAGETQARAATAQAEAKLRQWREVALLAARHALAEARANAVQAHPNYERPRTASRAPS